jgi:hypothetical protein
VRAGRASALAAFSLRLMLALTAGCSSGAAGPGREAVDAAAEAAADGDGTDIGDVGVDAGAPTYDPTYSAVWNEILSPRCALPFCHAGSADYLQLPNETMGYASLVNAPAAGPDCAATGLKRIDPGHPETSLLYLKVTNPPCGMKMPIAYGAPDYLDSLQVAQISKWITAGAPND